MNLGPLTLFSRRSCNGEPGLGWTIVAWHSRNSLTWSWQFVWHPSSRGTRRGFRIINGIRHHTPMIVWNTRRLGDFSYMRQSACPR